MLTVNIICIGKLKEEYWRSACAEYEKRLSSFCRLRTIELSETRAPEHPSPAQIAKVVESEGKLILSKLPSGGAVIPLCIEGKELNSPELSALLEQYPLEGKSEVTFIIGGSCGLSDAVKQRGKPPSVHVADDISASNGACDAAGADLQSISDRFRRKVS